jgi:hypothetical protein
MGKGNVRRIDLKCRYHNGSKAWGSFDPRHAMAW